mgnify:CR=1 FL=1
MRSSVLLALFVLLGLGIPTARADVSQPHYTQSPRHGFNIFEDFMANNTTNNTIGKYGWAMSAAGTAATFNNGAGEAGRPSIVNMDTGTTATGRTEMNTDIDGYILAGNEVWEAAIDITTLSNATDEFDIRVGLCDNTAGDCTDGVYFLYNRNVSANWIRSTANGGTRTQTASSTAVATGWLWLMFIVNSTETSVEFFVNNVSIGTNTLNIPTTAATGLMFQIIKSAGTASRDFDIDYVTFYQHNTTGR